MKWSEVTIAEEGKLKYDIKDKLKILVLWIILVIFHNYQILHTYFNIQVNGNFLTYISKSATIDIFLTSSHVK